MPSTPYDSRGHGYVTGEMCIHSRGHEWIAGVHLPGKYALIARYVSNGHSADVTKPCIKNKNVLNSAPCEAKHGTRQTVNQAPINDHFQGKCSRHELNCVQSYP
eukprot:3748974-Amphidinium_carterae.1